MGAYRVVSLQILPYSVFTLYFLNLRLRLACLLQEALCEQWQTLLVVAERLARHKEPAVTSVAAGLYVALFVTFDEGGSNAKRQEILQALHGHLGSGQKEEVTTALRVRKTHLQWTVLNSFWFKYANVW